MKKKTIIYSLLLGVLLTQAACKDDKPDNIVASVADNNDVAQVTSVPEIFSSDKQLKLKVEDFVFQDKLDDEAFLKTDPVPGVDKKDLVLLQTSSSALLFAVKNDRIKSMTGEQIEQKLKANADFKDITVTAPTDAQKNVLSESDNSLKNISFKYHYNFVDAKSSKTYNESCVGLDTGYLVCVTADKDFALLDKLINTAQIVKP